jgi:hypothetical protein
LLEEFEVSPAMYTRCTEFLEKAIHADYQKVTLLKKYQYNFTSRRKILFIEAVFFLFFLKIFFYLSTLCQAI